MQDLDASRPVATDGNDDCVNKPDGNYAERSCAPTFYACAVRSLKSLYSLFVLLYFFSVIAYLLVSSR